MDYTATFHTPLPSRDAARRIVTDLEGWWSPRIDRHADGFTVHFNASHATFAFDPGGSDMAFGWTCTEAHMIIEDVADATEWTGTQLFWSVTRSENGSTVRLTHRGLTPQIACFDVCRRGWQHFFETSLRAHLNGAPAQPHADRPAA